MCIYICKCMCIYICIMDRLIDVYIYICMYVGYSQNYGPLLVAGHIAAPDIWGYLNGTLILRTTHIICRYRGFGEVLGHEIGETRGSHATSPNTRRMRSSFQRTLNQDPYKPSAPH